jgi:hypothetical protein
MQDTSQNTSLMAPIYMGGYGAGKKREKDGKKTLKYNKDMEKFIQSIGLLPDEEEEDIIRRFSPKTMYLDPAFPGSLDKRLGSMPYNMPSSMRGRMGGYSPVPMGQQGIPMYGPMARPMPGDGNTASININYTAPDGTSYQMGVVAPQENRGKALYNVLNGLYGLMMAEGKSGQYKGGGKSSGSGYAGGKGGGK